MCDRDIVQRAAVSLLAVTLAALVSTPTLVAGSPPVKHWLSWNGKRRTASLELIASYNGANNGFNFDGYGRGKLLVRVPLGWRVVVTCRNAGAIAHSCAIVRGPQDVTPAFRAATTSDPTLGLRPGRTARFAFKASHKGTYRIACLVPGHEDARMWDVLVVARVKRPSISIRTGF
jgi:hypothetical protein